MMTDKDWDEIYLWMLRYYAVTARCLSSYCLCLPRYSHQV